MAGSTSGSHEHSDDSYHFERLHIEPIYDAFLCPLTKQPMRDPVTIETGQTFERQAILNYFQECRGNGRRLVCPVTFRELRSTDLSPSIALRNAIEEWDARNEAAQLDMARRFLSLSSSENESAKALKFVQDLCLKNQSNAKQVIRNSDLVPLIVNMLKSGNRRIRCLTLETIRVMVEDDDVIKEMIAEGDTVRTIVKSLSREREHADKEEAVSLLFELSKSELLCEKIGSVNGAILFLVGIASSTSEDPSCVRTADRTLANLAQCENNVREMAESGRLQPLLTLLLEGSPDTQLSMASTLGGLILNNDVKVFVAKTAGAALINLMRSNTLPGREAALRALNQISSDDSSARILIEAGILPPLVRDLFTVDPKHFPLRLKEVSATILANLVASGNDFDKIPVGPNRQTLVSEEIVHNLLHLINITGPAIESKLLQVLVGLTGSSSLVPSVVSAVKSSGATNSLVQFVDAPQRDLRIAAVRLLQNLSPHMGSALATCLCDTSGHLDALVGVVTENGGITEEQAAAVGFLADLPETDTALTRKMLERGAFRMLVPRIARIRQGDVKGGRFVTPYLEGLVKVLARVTYALSEESSGARDFCRDHNLAAVFVDLLQATGLDNVQVQSAIALRNLSLDSKNLTVTPEIPKPGFCCSTFFPCLFRTPVVTGLCEVHDGICSIRETFCLVKSHQAIDTLVSLLDQNNGRLVEASLGALCTLLEDGVNVRGGVNVLLRAEGGVNQILDLLLEERNEGLRNKAVWAVERLLTDARIAHQVSCNPNIGTALVDAYQHGDYRTRMAAERALKRIDRIPNFSGAFPNA